MRTVLHTVLRTVLHTVLRTVLRFATLNAEVYDRFALCVLSLWYSACAHRPPAPVTYTRGSLWTSLFFLPFFTIRAPRNFKSDAIKYTGSCTSAMPQTRGFHSPRC
eukprot:6658055-Pyramimonas_sp.AAC.1